MRALLNKAVGFFAFNYKLITSINYPTIFAIETTNRCNLNCVMCPRREMTREVGNMNFDLFKKIVDQAKHYTTFVRLHEIGEPLLDPNIIKMINYCKANNIKVEISTNATVLSTKIATKLLDCGLDRIILSIDGATKETYEAIRRNANFEKTKENIKAFLKLQQERQASKPRTILQFIQMKANASEVTQFVEEWRSTNIAEIMIKQFGTFSDQVVGIKELSELHHRYKDRMITHRPPCYYLWHSVVVLWDGRVVPCCRDFDAKIVLGDLNKETLLDIWNGDKMKQLRKQQIEGNFDNPLCKDCADWPEVYPCKFLFSGTNLKRILKTLSEESR